MDQSRHRIRIPQLRRTATIYAAPGSLHVDPNSPEPIIHLIQYDAGEPTERKLANVRELRKLPPFNGVTWVNVEGLGDEDVIRIVGEVYHLHPLALEDVVNVHQRAKVDRYGDHLFVTLRIPREEKPGETEQVSLFVGRKFVITFLEDPGDCFDPVRRRLFDDESPIRRRGADYLAYALLDTAVDAYFPLLETFGETLESLEDDVLLTPSPKTIGRVHDAKHQLRALRRAVWPLREAMNELARDQSAVIGDETRVYFRDLHDHAVQIIDFIETYREMGSDLTDLYLSSMSNRMNEIMRVLTIIATIFMPLSFIVGVYGMNFEYSADAPLNMPELHWRYGYVTVWGVLIAITVGMLYWFRRRGWMSRQADLSTWRTDDRTA